MFELSVALRFLKEGRIQTLLILVGICVGIAVQIFLSALIGGLQKDLINKTVGSAPHISGTAQDIKPRSLLPDSVPATSTIASSNRKVRPIRLWALIVRQLEATGWFTIISPVVDGSGFAIFGEKTLPVVIRGVQFQKADSLYSIKKRMVNGEARIDAGSILIGTDLAGKLRLNPGSTLRITSSTGANGQFTVRGIFDLESQAVNASWVIMTLSRAQTLLSLEGGVTGIEMQVPRVFEAQTISQTLSASFPALEWLSWQKTNANLLVALQSQGSSSNLIQILVLLAVTLGISSVLAVSAIQKARQIGILKAIGATNRTVSRVFLLMGGMLGFGGSILGCFAGYGLITGFLAGTAAATGRPLFPLSISPSLYAASILIATVAGTLAAFIPARRSARLNPIEVIRNG